ncbi:MAG: low molecular weight phosphatase family protein [Alphaproteobacteria bacterium]|nr:MAG: low molecular weight phosphatase family protein [Alphaproteobacteria bacterium]
MRERGGSGEQAGGNAPAGARPLPGSVLFACDHNAVRSPMAEGITKALYGRRIFVQSAGVRGDLEIDGFAIAACAEIGIPLERHRVRSFEDMLEWGDDLSAFDLVVALSPAAQRQALELTRRFALEVEYWPVLDPTGIGETREQRLNAYRQTRDQLLARIRARFGPTDAELGLDEGETGSGGR